MEARNHAGIAHSNRARERLEGGVQRQDRQAVAAPRECATARDALGSQTPSTLRRIALAEGDQQVPVRQRADRRIDLGRVQFT